MSIRAAIVEFIQYSLEIDRVEEDLNQLIIRLDKLALLASHVEYQFDDADYPESPGNDYTEVREKIKIRFPALGHYNTAAEVSVKIGNSTLLIGDAIDDLVDILCDLKEVLWCFNNTSDNNALWHFEFGYRSHWGRHLRELQLYLHDRWW